MAYGQTRTHFRLHVHRSNPLSPSCRRHCRFVLLFSIPVNVSDIVILYCHSRVMPPVIAASDIVGAGFGLGIVHRVTTVIGRRRDLL